MDTLDETKNNARKSRCEKEEHFQEQKNGR